MITLEQFSPLIGRNMDLTLYENGRRVFAGFARSVPDNFWSYRVMDFQIQNDDSIIFQVKKNSPKKAVEDKAWSEGCISVHNKTYRYLIKRYDEYSEHGINRGRIVKLTIKCHGKIVCRYERGWDMLPPDPDVRAALEMLLRSENY